jgi:outer membrane protein
MKKRNTLLAAFALFFCATAASGQEKWDLKRVVEFAWANNISIKQSDIQARIAEVNLTQNRWQQYPNANFSTNTGLQWGRSIDPTTNQFTSNQLLYQGFNLNAGVDVFNWSRIRNGIISARYEADASRADVEKVKNDIALSVASYYLQVLLSRQQVNVARVQMEQTRSQMQLTRKKVDAGALPEVDALTLEGQYANDSSNYIGAMATADQNLLTLKAVLNFDASLPFDIESPPVDAIPVDPILELQPETVYQVALKNQPAQKANALRLLSHEANIKSLRGAFYPTISIGGGLGTNFANTNSKVTSVTFIGYQPPQPGTPAVNVGGILTPIQEPSYQVTQGKKSFSELWTGWGTQINNNFRQNLGITISVPIINGGSARFNVERAKLNYQAANLTKIDTDQKLKNDIYQAYYSATAAMQKFNATKATVLATQKTYDFAVKRFDLGLLSTFDLITSQNNLTRSKLDLVYAQFDYVFKMKVLEFYKGLGIRLQ